MPSEARQGSYCPSKNATKRHLAPFLGRLLGEFEYDARRREDDGALETPHQNAK